MKKIIALLLLLVLCACTASAEAPDYASMTDAELAAAMAAVSAEMGRRARVEKTTETSESLGKISHLFPDEVLAKYVRDKCGKFSIEQTVTQAELDKILRLTMVGTSDYGAIHDLTGVSLLRNLIDITLNNGAYLGATLPDEICLLTRLESLSIHHLPSGYHTIPLASLPENIGHLTNLRSLTLTSTSIKALPDSIGRLTSLRSLEISYTGITELPDAIWSLELDSIGMRGLPIE